MILVALTLTDFGIYAGTQRLDLAPEPGRPITLVGGVNGSGKTTILEAILLCLHGRRALDATSERDYEDQIRTRIHVPPTDVGPRTGRVAAVRLELTCAEAGRQVAYEVERSWRRGRSGRIRETLSLWRDGEPQEDLTGTLTQSFLDGLMPPGLAGLFLFDGEKIQRLADDDSGHYLRDAVRRLLGLDLLERLRADLRRYVIAPAEGAASKQAAAALEQAAREVDAATAARDETRAALDAEATRRAETQEELARVRERFDLEGGALAEQRAKLERRRARAVGREAAADARLRELVTAALPLAIAPEIGARLARRLEHERSVEEDEAVRRRIAGAAEELAARLRVRSRTDQDPVALLRQVLAPVAEQDALVHDVSPVERARMLAQLAGLDAVAQTGSEVGGALRKARADLQVIDDALDAIPDDADLAPLVEQMQKVAGRIAHHDQELRRLDEELRSREHALAAAQRSLKEAETMVADVDQQGERRELARRTISVIDGFDSEVLAAKIGDVELHTARYFNRLSRKGKLLGSVHIDLDSFVIALERWDGAVLPKARLSAGERQLLAIALLWALATVAERRLPVVVDTPLARLDATHRKHLLTEYFPVVSDQVVMLSTDTEIDAAAVRMLGPFVTRRYRLKHDLESCATTVTTGYFERGAVDAG